MFSFGRERESENAPLAERCFPTLGDRIATWYASPVECAAPASAGRNFARPGALATVSHVGP